MHMPIGIFFQSYDIVENIDTLTLKLSILKIILKCDSHKHIHTLVHVHIHRERHISNLLL